MSNYIEEVIESVKKKNPSEALFHQAVEEVLTTLKPVIDADSRYKKYSARF